MNDKQEKAFARQGKLIDIQREINDNVEEALSLDKAKIKEQDKKIAELEKTIANLEQRVKMNLKNIDGLWYNLRIGGYGDE
jgi:hypothetical protein